MNATEFFNLVVQMRDAQKNYFKTPSEQYKQKREYLMLSKRLENEIDQEIKRVYDKLALEEYKKQNPTLPGFE